MKRDAMSLKSLSSKLPQLLRSMSSQGKYRAANKFDFYGNAPVPPSKYRFIPESGTYPKGFLAGSARIGIKAANEVQPDLILIASEKPSCGAAVFTKNQLPAASVQVSKEILRKTQGHGLRGVVANSWCANCLTGKGGVEDAAAMSKKASECVTGETDGGHDSTMMVMSTGIILDRLPMNDILMNISKIHNENMGTSHEHWLQAARGICTTDTFPKLASRTFSLPSSPNVEFRISGITKGAGMVHPNMATTLGIMCTDANVSPRALQECLSATIKTSYNCISIDGDTSTNDTVALLANGAAGGPEINFQESSATQSADYNAFKQVLAEFTVDLAKLVIRDGEGASKFVTIRIVGSPSQDAARHIASTLARSILVKTALNWGAVLCTLGYSVLDTRFEHENIIVPSMVSLSFVPTDGSPELKCVVKGEAHSMDEARAKEIMENEDVEILVNLRDDGEGKEYEEAVYWTCDLTQEFVTMNRGYLT